MSYSASVAFKQIKKKDVFGFINKFTNIIGDRQYQSKIIDNSYVFSPIFNFGHNIKTRENYDRLKKWTELWVVQCLHAMENNPQHNYIFLTKAKGLKYSFFYNDTFNYSCNLYFGRSITRNNELSKTDYCNFSFWSIEPLLEPIKIDFNSNFNHIRQVIIGAETGNRIDKVVPKKEWVDDIVKQCDKANVRVFMKSSLKKIMGKDFRQDKLLWEK